MTAKPREPITHWGLSQVLNILYLIPSVMTHDCSTTGCPKKLTYRMLLEPLCTQTVQSQVAGTTTGGPPVTGKTFFGRFLLRLLAGSNAPKSYSWANLAPQHSTLVRIFFLDFFGTPCTWGSDLSLCCSPDLIVKLHCTQSQCVRLSKESWDGRICTLLFFPCVSAKVQKSKIREPRFHWTNVNYQEIVFVK